MFSTTILSAALVVIASLQTTSALAIDDRAAKVPEVIPGPGLPSLKSLGLTSADLYAMGKPAGGECHPRTLTLRGIDSSKGR